MQLGIVASHPIQYQATWFKALAQHPGLDLEVLFCHKATPSDQSRAGFGVEFDWDVPLLDGYSHTFLRNSAKRPSVSSFPGLDTPEITAIVRGNRYDAVIVLGWGHKSFVQAIRACWRSNVPIIVRGDSHLRTERAPWKAALKSMPYRWCIPKFDACLAVGTWSREYFLHYGARDERIFLVPHVIDEARFIGEAQRLAPQRAHLRRQWSLDGNSIVFLFAAKFIAKKRPMDFIRAVQAAASSGAHVTGLMVGDGPLRAGCEEYARHNAVAVRFAGFLNQTEIVQAYVAADALVVPSDGRETWGLVVNEAMACGRACLVSDRVGCGPDLVTAGETGDIFPVGDTNRLAQLLVHYTAHHGALQTMGTQARERVKAYAPKAAVDGVLQAVSAVVSGA